MDSRKLVSILPVEAELRFAVDDGSQLVISRGYVACHITFVEARSSGDDGDAVVTRLQMGLQPGVSESAQEALQRVADRSPPQWQPFRQEREVA